MRYPVKIGIVGGGQLGKMLTQAAKKLGFFVLVIDPTPQSPAGQVADKQIIGGYKEEKAIRELANEVDVITVDAEFVNDTALAKLEAEGKLVHPSPKTIAIIKDKLRQKQFLRLHTLPTAAFMEVSVTEDIKKASKDFGYPMVLKARENAYDGKGNFLINSEQDIEKGLEKLDKRALYVEKYVPFVKELAVMVARSTSGEIKVYPVVETRHTDHICDVVMVPSDISETAQKNAQNLAKKVMEHLGGAGVFGIEMFLEKNDNVLINEIAPRVHNSGHYTIEGSITSQFEQHIRAITGLPLGATELVPKAAVMKNILGTSKGAGFPTGMEKALAIPGVSVHIYGKHEARVGRKMGHITVIGNSVEECLKKAEEARKALII